MPECQGINRWISCNYFLLTKPYEWFTFVRNKWFTLNRNSGSLWIGIINRIEMKSFEAAKFITNGLVVEGKYKKQIKKHIDDLGTNAKLNFSKYPTRKNRSDSVVGWVERYGGIEE